MKATQPKPRLSDIAYEGLRRAIIKAELLPGSPIDERSCMELLSVGRTPLREALQRLSQEDLTLAVPQRGYFVSSTSATDFFHLQEFRLNTEVLSARMAATRISEAQLDCFEELIKEAQEGIAARCMAIDWHLGLDERMHHLVAEASGNPYLVKALKSLYALSVRSLYVAKIPLALVYEDIGDYVEIYNALANRDPARAEAAMRAHLAPSDSRILRSVDAPSIKRERKEIKL